MPSSLAPWSAQRWHALFCTHQPQLLAYLTGKTGSRDEAHDLVQETWLRLAAAPAQLPDGSSASQEAARAYLFATAKHLALDHLRQRGVQQRSLQDWQQLQPPSASDVADQAMYRQALDLVAQVIAELPERMQAALLAHRLQGQTHAQIAQSLQVSLNTVERDLMQADACLEAALLRWRGDAQGTRQAAARRRRRGALGALLGAAGLACVGWPGWQMWQQRLLWQARLASGNGMQRSLDLPDGSQLRIDAASHVELRYRAGLREAQLLAGAAFFSVARDTARPFVVQAGPVRIRVLGTRFGVELEADAVLVQVESGQVRVERLGSDQQIVLEAQQSLQVPLADSEAAWQAQPQARPAAWRDGELVFDQQPLGQVVARLGRYSSRPLQIDAGAAQLAISGHVRIVLAERWLRNLPQLAPVQVKTQADGALLISLRAKR